MTKAPTPTEISKKQRDNIKYATKNFDYTTIADRLGTVSNSSHPNGVVLEQTQSYFKLVFKVYIKSKLD